MGTMAPVIADQGHSRPMLVKDSQGTDQSRMGCPVLPRAEEELSPQSLMKREMLQANVLTGEMLLYGHVPLKM